MVKNTVPECVTIMVMVILIAVTGSAMAAHPVPAGTESSNVIVQTSAKVVGNLQSYSDLGIQQGTGNLTSPLGSVGGQVSTVVYSGDIMAINGETENIQTTNIRIDNVVNGQANVQTNRIITFEVGDGGRMVTSENILVQTGVTVATDDTSVPCICQFGDTIDATLPTENEIVQAGSKLDATEVSASSSSGVRAIVDSPGTKVSLDYSIDAHGINQTAGTKNNPAIGSATAYVAGLIMQGCNGTTQRTGMQYHDVTSVDGLFDLSEEVRYTSAPN